MTEIIRGHRGCGRYWAATFTNGERFATFCRQRDGGFGLADRPARHRYEVTTWRWDDPDNPITTEYALALEAKRAVRDSLSLAVA